MISRIPKRILNRFPRHDYQTLNRIEINRRNLVANTRLIKDQNPGQTVIPVLKANAYGHGLRLIAEALNDIDCPFLAVDGYFEAAQIRRLTKHRVLVMGYIKPENVSMLDTKRCSFVVQDIKGLEAFAGLNRPVQIHLELNTGMNRLGLQTEELDDYLAALKRYPKLHLEGVMTHLADADNAETNDFTVMQIKAFDKAVKHIRDRGFDPLFLHVAQTAGSVKARSRYANAIRLGIGLYGINPLNPADRRYKQLSGLRPVLELVSTIIKTYDLKKGDKVSYNGIFTADRSARIGILPLGYHEGLPRELSNTGCVTHGDKRLPIVGRVCMNHTAIDISGTDLKVGDEIVVISGDPAKPNSVQAVSLANNIFSYDWLARLASSTKRMFV